MNPTRLLVLLCWAKRGPGLARFPVPIGGDRGWESLRRKVDGKGLVGLGELGARQRRREALDAFFALFVEREELATRRPRREARWRDSVTPRVALSPCRRAHTDRCLDEVRMGPQAQPVAAPEWPPLTVPRAASALPGQEVQP